tara:strand:+ start:825 stop:1259 length:435 start_codon:yes stop_codon:yes gene_type:complete
MIRVFSLLLFIASIPVHAWECDTKNYTFEDKVKNSKQLVHGKIVSGKLVEEKVIFTLDVIESFKGDSPSLMTIETKLGAPNPDITLGAEYVFFMKESGKVTFCDGALLLAGWNYSFVNTTIEALRAYKNAPNKSKQQGPTAGTH